MCSLLYVFTHSDTWFICVYGYDYLGKSYLAFYSYLKMMRYRMPGITLTNSFGQGWEATIDKAGSARSWQWGWKGGHGSACPLCREAEGEQLWPCGHILPCSQAAVDSWCPGVCEHSDLTHGAHGSFLDVRAMRMRRWETGVQSRLFVCVQRFPFEKLRNVTLLYSLSCFSIAKVTYVT